MNQLGPTSPHEGTAKGLTLLVSADSPRSQRARDHLHRALEEQHLKHITINEVDVLRAPHEALRLGVFATPALIWTNGAGVDEVLYGDLSNRDGLLAFLANRVDDAVEGSIDADAR